VLVTRILGECPGCHCKNSYGNVSVDQNRVLRGCTNCRYSTLIPLPELKKNVLYLDQFFFSSAFKNRDERFTAAAEKIGDLAHKQVLIAPFSSVHEDETHQWRGYGGKNKDDLMEFIKATSRGHKFEPAYDVEREQLIRAFEAFLAGQPDDFAVERSDALRGDIDEWDGYFRVDVDRYLGNIDQIRDLKDTVAGELVDAFAEWRTSKNTFEHDVEFEYATAAKTYVDTYAKYAVRIARAEYDALFDSPVVESLMRCMGDEISPEIRLGKVGEFLRSSHFKQTAYQWISCRIFAALKDQVQRGAYQQRDVAVQRLRGFFNDITHVATYLPYCDAFVMDGAMAALSNDPRLALEARYSTRIFTLSNWDDMFDWFKELEAGMSKEHRAGLTAAYP
jgi:hypothetical protein